MAGKRIKGETGKVNQKMQEDRGIMIKVEEGIYQQWINNVMN
jgi:hypothetical protein